jgi:hypothetical protein
MGSSGALSLLDATYAGLASFDTWEKDFGLVMYWKD